VVGVAIGALGYFVARIPAVRAKGWVSAVPNAALVTVWPLRVDDWIGDALGRSRAGDPAIIELNKRIERGELSHWEASWWASRVEGALRRQGRLVSDVDLATAAKIARARVTRRFDGSRFEDPVDALA
jgi:hypothetical protein